MKVKTLKKDTKNLLNNQNYILWKTEKKKLLSKFFVEKILNIYFFRLLSLFYNFIHNIFIFVGMFLYFLLNLFIIYIIYINLFVIFSFGTVLALLLILMFTLSFLSSWKNILKTKKIKIKSIKEYLSWPDSITIDWKMKTSNFKERVNINIDGIIYVSFLIGSILLLPLFIAVLVLVLIFFLIITFIFKWIDWYKFIKYFPETKIINKFTKLKNNKAKNKYYKIKVK